MPTVFNAANEKAVSLFLENEIAYLQIPEMIEACMEQHRVMENPSVEQILHAEEETYRFIMEQTQKKA